MANLRRTKLKAKRCGCDVKEVDECNSIVEVHELMRARDNTPNDVPENNTGEVADPDKLEVADGISD